MKDKTKDLILFSLIFGLVAFGAYTIFVAAPGEKEARLHDANIVAENWRTLEVTQDNCQEAENKYRQLIADKKLGTEEGTIIGDALQEFMSNCEGRQ